MLRHVSVVLDASDLLIVRVDGGGQPTSGIDENALGSKHIQGYAVRRNLPIVSRARRQLCCFFIAGLPRATMK